MLTEFKIRRKKHIMKFPKNSATLPTNLCKAFHNTFDSEARDLEFISVPAEVAVIHIRTARPKSLIKNFGDPFLLHFQGEKKPKEQLRFFMLL